MSAHTLDYGRRARQYDTTDFQDASVKRIIKKLSDIERAALDAAELEEVWRKWGFSFANIYLREGCSHWGNTKRSFRMKDNKTNAQPT